MNIFDKLLASGYYAFNGELNSHIVRMAITFLRKNGMSFSRDELVMKEITKYMYFDCYSLHYVLKDGYTVSDLEDFIDKDLITLFHNLMKAWDDHHTRRIYIEEPNFESAMQKVIREEPTVSENKQKVKRI